MGQCLPAQLKKTGDRRAKVRHLDEDKLAQDHGDELEHDAAIDYALRKNKQRENYFVMEIMISVQNLPFANYFDLATTFAVISVDLNSLDDHDKIEIGNVVEKELNRYLDVLQKEEKQPEFGDDDYKSVWVQKIITEVKKSDSNPIFDKTFTFNSMNQMKFRFKIDIYQCKNKEVLVGVIADSTLLGSNEYLIADGVRKKREGDKKPMIHPTNQESNEKYEELGTAITLRYELVE